MENSLLSQFRDLLTLRPYISDPHRRSKLRGKIRNMTFQSAKTEIIYPPHVTRILWVWPRSLINSRAAQSAGVMTKHLSSARMFRQIAHVTDAAISLRAGSSCLKNDPQPFIPAM